MRLAGTGGVPVLCMFRIFSPFFLSDLVLAWLDEEGGRRGCCLIDGVRGGFRERRKHVFLSRTKGQARGFEGFATEQNIQSLLAMQKGCCIGTA